jgi:hypothetical protein
MIYPLITYDLVRAKAIIEAIPQNIDLSMNVLRLPKSRLKGLGKADRDWNVLVMGDLEATLGYTQYRPLY